MSREEIFKFIVTVPVYGNFHKLILNEIHTNGYYKSSSLNKLETMKLRTKKDLIQLIKY